MGCPITMAEYYISDGYDLPPEGEVTDNEANLKRSHLLSRSWTLELMSQPSYPGNDLDHLTGEEEMHYHLTIANGLAISYLGLFVIKYNAHEKSINTLIGEATVEALRKTMKAAQDCIDIPYKKDIWKESFYNNNKTSCEAKKRIAELLIPLEQDRLLVARSVACYDKILSDCDLHKEVTGRMKELYVKYLEESEKLLAAL